jgi:membrane-associated phospholipid phosphatase
VRTCRATLAVAAVLLAAGLVTAEEGTPPPETGEQDSAAEAGEHFWPRVWRDLGDLAARPAHLDGRDWRNLGLSAVAIGATYAFDEDIRETVQGNRTESRDDFAEAIRPLGNLTGPAVLLGACWAAGRIWDRQGLVAFAEDGFEASLFSVVLAVPALKKVAGRAKPEDGLGASHFEPFSNYDSFPSGEAAQAFTLAAVVAGHTRNRWVQGAAWGIAGLVAWGRLNLDGHWGSDVVAGALIGAGIGSWVTRRRPAPVAGAASLVIQPVIAPRTFGVSGSISW